MPCACAFDDPATRWIPPTLRATFAAMAEVGRVMPLPNRHLDLRVVVPFVEAQMLRAFRRRPGPPDDEAIQRGRSHFHVMGIGGGHHHGQRGAALVGQRVPFRAELAAICRIGACLRPPKGALTMASQVGLHLRERGVVVGMVQWWDITGKLRPEWGFGHGDLTETSLMLSLTPDLVDMSAATAPQETAPAPQLIPVTPWDFVWENGVVHVYLRTHDVSARGDLKEESGKPPQAATREFGDEIVALVIDYLCRFVEFFRTIRLRPGTARE